MWLKFTAIALAALLLSLGSSMTHAQNAAEHETELTLQAYAAGYLAGFTCSATFNANKNPTAIQRDELTGSYELVQQRITELEAEVDYERKRVVVSYATEMPPRIAQWRPGLGCVHLPVGSAADYNLADLPQLSDGAARKIPQQDDGQPWQERAELNQSSGSAALDRVIAQAFSDHYGAGARTSAVLIATPEKIIAEHYRPGFTPTTAQRTWSVAKSIGTSVIGVAVQQGILDPSAPAALKQWQSPFDPRLQISVEHLLHMASGLDSNVAGNRTDRLYMGGGRVLDTAASVALEAVPGQRWKYANNDTLLALRALAERFPNQQAYIDFPYTQLLDKLGMHHTFIETDWNGDFILSSQVWTTSRDLARLGVLHLQQGRWQGEQILPPDWLSYISRPAPAQPPLRNSAGDLTPGYGAQWWLYNRDFPGLPNDTIAARGNRGQYLFIIPSKQLVVVRRGYDLRGEPRFREERFVADVLAALEQSDL